MIRLDPDRRESFPDGSYIEFGSPFRSELRAISVFLAQLLVFLAALWAISATFGGCR